MRSLRSWSDILDLWGLMNRPPWLKMRSTGTDVQSVQKTLSNNHCKQANCLLSFTRRHGVSTSVPSSVSCMYVRYELTTLVSGTAAFSAYGLILTQMPHINQLLTTSLVNANWQDFFVKTKTETKTFTSRPWPRLYSLSSMRLETKTVVSRTTSLLSWEIGKCFQSKMPLRLEHPNFVTTWHGISWGRPLCQIASLVHSAILIECKLVTDTML